MQTVKCRKCGRPHRIEEWKGVKFLYCPYVCRMILLNEDKKDV